MPSALLWAYLEEMIFCNIAAQPDLRVWLGCTFTGRAAAGKCIFPLWPSVLIPRVKRRIF
jgi:hypothetical protein